MSANKPLHDPIEEFWHRIPEREDDLPLFASGLICRRPIVCLCGSTKFQKEYEIWNLLLSTKGFLVWSVACFAHTNPQLGITKEMKIEFDAIHLEKIMTADCVLVIDVNGYIGYSTSNEQRFATSIGKPVHLHTEHLKTFNRFCEILDHNAEVYNSEHQHEQA